MLMQSQVRRTQVVSLKNLLKMRLKEVTSIQCKIGSNYEKTLL